MWMHARPPVICLNSDKDTIALTLPTLMIASSVSTIFSATSVTAWNTAVNWFLLFNCVTVHSWKLLLLLVIILDILIQSLVPSDPSSNPSSRRASLILDDDCNFCQSRLYQFCFGFKRLSFGTMMTSKSSSESYGVHPNLSDSILASVVVSPFQRMHFDRIVQLSQNRSPIPTYLLSVARGKVLFLANDTILKFFIQSTSFRSHPKRRSGRRTKRSLLCNLAARRRSLHNLRLLPW